ncbi:MAG: MlaD family protein [Desulfobacterales bacterium]|nr:MlaD family protein [Desulfobacterales bacterium]
MDLNFSKKEKTVGTFIICIVVILLTTVVIIGRGKDWFKTYITYYTTFNESYNLKEDAAVKLFKADIGKVKKIILVENKVKVKLAILEEYSSRIRSDSVTIVESPTFIGSEYISIKPGSADSPLIPEGGEINSTAKKSISDLMSEFQVEETAKKVVGMVQNISEIIQIMRDPDGLFFTTVNNLNKTISHLEAITGDIQAGKGTAGSILKSREVLQIILDDLGKVTQILAGITEATPEITNKVQDNLATIKKVGEEVLDSISSIKRILKEMEEGSRDIPEVTRSTKRGVNEIRDGVENIDKVVESIKKNFLIKSNLPPEPKGKNIDAGLRQ